jgi:peptidoglycan/xylan/chitin deacetylase (PgdA/CDA1 family)
MKRLALTALIVIGALLYTAYGLHVKRERARVVPVPILMYHNIDDIDDDVWCVRPEQFEQHLEFLKQEGYETILPSALVTHRRWGRPLPDKPVIITFDDGYATGLNIAEPILKRYGYRAVAYLVTKWVADKPENRIFHPQRPNQPCITWPEVRAMERRGTIAFGGHSRSHANLAALRDPRDEIEKCYRDILRNAWFLPEGFCYPYGQRRPETVAIARASPFSTAVVCDNTIAYTGTDMDLFQLPRISIYGGRQRFKILSVTTNEYGDELIVRASNDGFAIPVCPRLVTGDTTMDQGWLQMANPRKDPVEWRWPVPPEGRNGRTLELWDSARVLRLFTAEL